jgi:hypothetical protein
MPFTIINKRTRIDDEDLYLLLKGGKQGEAETERLRRL